MTDLPRPSRYSVSAGTGWPRVSRLTGIDSKMEVMPLHQCGRVSHCLIRSLWKYAWPAARMLNLQETMTVILHMAQ